MKLQLVCPYYWCLTALVKQVIICIFIQFGVYCVHVILNQFPCQSLPIVHQSSNPFATAEAAACWDTKSQIPAQLLPSKRSWTIELGGVSNAKQAWRNRANKRLWLGYCRYLNNPVIAENMKWLLGFLVSITELNHLSSRRRKRVTTGAAPRLWSCPPPQ